MSAKIEGWGLGTMDDLHFEHARWSSSSPNILQLSLAGTFEPLLLGSNSAPGFFVPECLFVSEDVPLVEHLVAEKQKYLA